MTDILTPSECATLAEIAERAPFPASSWQQHVSDGNVLSHAAPRMLATIADLRAEVGSLKAANAELQRDDDDRDERIDSQYAIIAAHEATIAELRKELEERK